MNRVLSSKRGRFALAVVTLFVFVAVFGALLAPQDPEASSTEVLEGPSGSHLLGTTEVGADVFSQLLVGARVSIVVGFSAAVISAVLGAAVGLTGGYFGGITDKLIDAFENWFLVIPQLPLMVVLGTMWLVGAVLLGGWALALYLAWVLLA